MENQSLEDLGKRLYSERRKKKQDQKVIKQITDFLIKRRLEFHEQLKDFKSLDAVKTDEVLRKMQIINRILK